ncbi:MAG TPA: hypothetical protein VKG66_00300, partial [Steroidobacteraceae bacterium]|nr:hypothetical protein [Steroidobacteraceae bacterium]
MLLLRRGDRDVMLMRCRRFLCSGLGSNPAAAAGVTDAGDLDIVDHGFVVNIGDVHGADIDDRAVVVQVIALPVAAF